VGWSWCGQLGSAVVEFEFQVYFFLYRYVIDDTYTVLQFAENFAGVGFPKLTVA
jgi:hypothetical protein